MNPKIAKFLKGAAIAAAGAALAYVGGVVIPSLQVDGQSAVLVGLLSAAVNGLKLMLSKIEEPAPR